MPICKLCLNVRPLINAHVIPRAFWQLPPPGEGPAKLVSNTPGVYPRRTLVGVYDNGILCAECDVKLGTLDQHAAEVLIQEEEPPELFYSEQLCGRRYDRADPATLYRFVISVAWRASISTHRFFGRVRLGPYEDRARRVLSEGSHDRDMDCVLGEWAERQVPLLDPHKSRFDGVLTWVIYADRFIFYVKASRSPPSEWFADRSLRPGASVISVVRRWHGSKERSVMRNIALANPNAFPRR